MARLACSIVLVGLALLSGSTTAAGESRRHGTTTAAESESRRLVRAFEVTVWQGPSSILLAAGTLTLDIQRETGNFTGRLTPAHSFQSVLFRITPVSPPNAEPVAGVTEIRVKGTIRHHAVNMVMLDVGGSGQHIYGVGTTENDPGEGFHNDPGRIGGSAAGPLPGDRGDWRSIVDYVDAVNCLINNVANFCHFFTIGSDLYLLCVGGC